jgi:hypothetical protein
MAILSTVVRFRLRDGTTLQSSPPAPRGGLPDLKRLNQAAGHAIESETCLSGTGERMDRHWVVSVVADSLYGADYIDRRVGQIRSDRASPRGAGD